MRSWARLHPKQQAHPGRGTRQPRPIARHRRARGGQPLANPAVPAAGAVAVVGRVRHAGCRPALAGLRVAFRLGAHLALLQAEPRLDNTAGPPPAQADRWTWLVVAASTQLRLGRPGIADRRLLWERTRSPGNLTPSRVRRALAAVLPVVGAPTSPPKLCGRWADSARRGQAAVHYPVLKRPRKTPFLPAPHSKRHVHRARCGASCGQITSLAVISVRPVFSAWCPVAYCY